MSVSIVIPAYNVAPFIGRCIESCLAQSEKDIEIVCVDDGSKDETGTIIDKYAALDARVRPIHKQNEGVVIARATGVAAAKGEWIYFVDGDDWIAPEAVESLLSLIDDETDIVAANHTSVVDGVEKPRRIGFPHAEMLSSEYINECMRRHHGYIWNKLFRKSLIAGVEVDSRYTMNEDYLMNIKAGLVARKIKYLDCSLYYFYWSKMADRSIKYDHAKGVFSCVQVHREVAHILEETSGLSFVLHDGYLTYLLHNVGNGINDLVNYEGFQFFKRELRRAFRRTPLKLAREILCRKGMLPSYFCYIVSIRLARIVQRVYKPCFDGIVVAYHKLGGGHGI